METSGYSKTPLAKKLGLKENYTYTTYNTPKRYIDFFQEFPENTSHIENPAADSLDFIHVFCKGQNCLIQHISEVKKALKKSGILWVSWPKQASTIVSEINREDVRDFVLKVGLVDIKVCAIDKDWSGLKFMYRKKDR